MLNFVTLFDKNYMSRGIVLYESLAEHCGSGFSLYVLAMDDVVAGYLGQLGHGNLHVITLADMKGLYPVLERLEKERTRGEFSWTLSSFSIQYALRKYGLDSCTYVDSDVCFYGAPELLLDGLGGRSVLITEHNYTPEYDQTATSGKFCVQFMHFRNNEDGNRVLEWWRSSCEEWCYARAEDGKFGDQKYLDDWESRFEGIVYNCHDIGCGVAPWNVQRYEVSVVDGDLYVTDRVSKVRRPVVFYHFHGLAEMTANRWCLSHYRLAEAEKEILYRPYIEKLKNIENGYPKGLVGKRYKRISFLLCRRVLAFFVLLFPCDRKSWSWMEKVRNIEFVLES